MPVTFTNLTRSNEIGANAYLLEVNGHRLILDAGLHPRAEGPLALPNFSLVPEGSVEAIVLSHAHQDHVGALPVLMRRQPRAPVFMTLPTSYLSEIMLHNSVNVMIRRKEEGTGEEVFFTHREIDQCARRWRSLPLGQRYSLAGERMGPGDASEPSLEFCEAGHILGSSGTLLRAGAHTILYTGDINLRAQTVMPAAALPESGVETLIIETTRGDSPQREGFTREDEERRFVEAVKGVLAAGGCVFVPVFALGKTQEILAMLLESMRLGELREVPIYIGGLSTKLTEVSDRLLGETRLPIASCLLEAPNLFTLSGPEAWQSQLRPGRIYALSSGMMTENTLSNQLVRQILGDAKSGVFFVGYADPESPAGRLLALPRGGLIRMTPDAPEQPVAAQVERFDFSGHADRESIRAYVNRLRPKTTVLVHGDTPALEWFRARFQEDQPGMRVIIPEPGIPVEIA